MALEAGAVDDAGKALSVIESSGRETLRDVRWLVATMREDTEPPTLAAVPDLVAAARRSGLDVVLSVLGPIEQVSPGTGAAAYRIVQEALTNVMRHGGPASRSTVHIDVGADVVVDVVDVGTVAAASHDGSGVTGMRERAAVAGGTLHAGPGVDGCGCGWSVHAVLPKRRGRLAAGGLVGGRRWGGPRSRHGAMPDSTASGEPRIVSPARTCHPPSRPRLHVGEDIAAMQETAAQPMAQDPGSSSPYDESDPAFPLHRGGKLETTATVPVRSPDDLSLAYTPGVARVCSAIKATPELVHELTWKSHVVAIVTDGTAVLGLGDIGPRAALPVMEGKAVLFKEFGGIDAVPICLDTTDVDEIVETVVRIAPGFGGVNLEDISAPRCFEVEQRLNERLDIPVFHDDQHGTAIVVLAALRNAARLTGRVLGDLRAVVSGAGAAGVAVTTILREAGIGDITVADSKGVLHSGRADLTEVKRRVAASSNRGGRTGTLAEALDGADVFIGVSGGVVPESAVAAMAADSIVFALANPHPEIHPDVASRHARVVATGRSDYPNQINNVLAFPGVFRGALSVRASAISEGMKLAAAEALAAVVADELTETCIVPSPFDERVAPAVADAVAAAARRDGVARR